MLYGASAAGSAFKGWRTRPAGSELGCRCDFEGCGFFLICATFRVRRKDESGSASGKCKKRKRKTAPWNTARTLHPEVRNHLYGGAASIVDFGPCKLYFQLRILPR